MEKEIRKTEHADLLRHAEHMCSIRISSCGAEARAKRNADPSSGAKNTGNAEDICTPLFTGA